MSIIKINCDLNNYYSTTSGISQRRDVAKKRLRLLVVNNKEEDSIVITPTSLNFRIQSIMQDINASVITKTSTTAITPSLQPLLVANSANFTNENQSKASSTAEVAASVSKINFPTTKVISSKFKNKFRLKISRYLGKCFKLNFFFIILILIELYAVRPVCGLLAVDPISLESVANSNSDIVSSSMSNSNNHHHHQHNSSSNNSGSSSSNNNGGGGGGHYLDKLDNLERSVAAVLIKVAYGTTSTTKRSIPDNSYVPSLTTIATPPLTTLRYLEKSAHQQQINLHHRSYELDLERDHALPTSAPNADILKSNSNPTYPNPNRHHNHDRDRHRHLLNSTPSPSLPNILKKSQPTIPMYPGDMPSYSPPARSFFTPPLPPEYQNPFADKPTLRGTNNEGVIVNTGTYINRRPIPPPSLMPGHERIPFRPPDLGGGSIALPSNPIGGDFPATSHKPQLPLDQDVQRKKALNTPSQKGGNNRLGNGVDGYGDGVVNTVPLSDISDPIHNPRQEHLPSIRRILSGSNGRKEDIPEVLLKQVTSRPAYNPQPPSSPVVVVQTSPENMPDDGRGGSNQNPNINQSKNFDLGGSETSSDEIDDSNEPDELEQDQDEPKMQPKIKMSTKSTDTPNAGGGGIKQPQQKQHHLHQNGQSSSSSSSSTSSTTVSSATASSSSSSSSSSTKHNTATWSVAWNIHVYLSVILFTILGVYSIFKMIFYNKLTHLFSQSYFICIHLILITICSSRIFYLCYDAYNIHSTFHIFVSEILLNLPATFMTISFSVLILFLLIKSLNHKNNRYSALIRPLTVVVGSSVHVVLCITLHYVESYTTSHSQQFYYQQLYRNGLYHRVGTNNMVLQQHHLQQPLLHHHHQLTIPPPPPPRVLSLICQIIYIFICLSLGLLYLYIYRILKRILRSKSQNYIHGFQNLSYAIHITIATALLFVLLAALQIFGAISISTTRPLITSSSDMDWLQWGYQFSLRLIEIAIITLMSWVAGLKTSGGGGGAGVGVGGMGPGGGGMQREKNADSGHNVAGFFLPCTSSSSQEQFETDYPAICNANTNLHTYTLRTGKPIYDDTFALNSLGGGGQGSMGGGSQRNDFQLQSTNNFVRPYDTGSLQSGSGIGSHMHSRQQIDSHSGHHSDFLTETQTDHYENPNFELRSTSNRVPDQHQYSDNCYSEPLNGGGSSTSGYDFSNFERPKFGGGIRETNVPTDIMLERPISRNNDRTSNSSRNHHRANLDRTNYENPERRSSNSTHSCTSARYATYNSFERHGVVRKSGTLNNIGGITNGRNGSSSSAASSSSRPSGVQTLSTANHHPRGGVINGSARIMRTGVGGAAELMMIDPSHPPHHHHQRESSDDQRELTSHPHRGGGGPIKALNYYRECQLERSNSAAMQQYILQSDDDMVIGSNAERTNLINSSGSRNGGVDGMSGPVGGGGGCSSSGITSSTSGGNLTDNGSGNGGVGLVTGDRGGNNTCGTGTTGSSGMGSSSGESANSGSMLVAEHGFVRFRALDDINNAQGVGIHNASIRTTKTGGRSKEKQRYASNT